MRPIPILLSTLLLAAGAAAQNHWYVNPAGSDAATGTSPGTAFKTVNHANAVASNGDVIHLAAATFGDEQGVVLLGNKTVTLVGAGQGVTVVKANTSTDIILPAGSPLPGAPDTYRVAIAVNGTGRVDMRDMTLDNGFSIPASGRALDLYVGGGADSVIDNVEFTNARTNPINGIQGPVAVTIRGDNAGDVTNVTMHNCLVHEYGKGGVVANFNATLNMDDCRVDGFGHAFLSLAAQNGIQVSRGANCSIRRTTVTNSWYDPDTVTATGILLFDATSPVLVEDCSFGNCQAGIYFFSTAASVISATLRRNRVHAAEFGYYDQNVSGLTVTENSFSVSQSGDNDDAWDDAGGNSYSGNNYSSVTVAGPHLLPGLGAAVDATAKPGCRGFAAPVATALPAGHSPLGLVVTGLDANGSPDFAALCQTATTPVLDVGLNNGTGSFTVTSLPFGNAAGDPVAIVAGEFNGAAGRDLAVLTRNHAPALTENKVYVFANNGAGGFSLLSVTTLVGATAPSDLAAGNVDANAADDIAVSDAGSAGFIPGSATVLLNNGTGTVFAPVPLLAAFTAACRGVAIADLDGDGNKDVAVTEGDATTGRLHLFRGNGLGVFVPFGSSPLTTSVNANKVLATDLEGDGDQDLLVSSTRDAFGLIAGAVDVFENHGAASFKHSEWRCDNGPAALAAGDFDNDADPDSQRRDAAVVNMAGGSVSVLGTWTAGCGYGSGGIGVNTPTPTGLGIADVDGDGYADLVWCDGSTGTVNVASGVVQARADSYGAGSTGTSGRIPYLSPVGAPALPVQPNATFGLGLSNGRPLSVAAFAAGVAPAPLVAGNLLISGIGATWVVVTNVFGEAAVPLPIPAAPPLLGFPLYCQAGVFDPNATESFFVGVALTKGLKIRVGN